MAQPNDPNVDAEAPLVLLAVAPDLAEQIFRQSELDAIAGRAVVEVVADPGEFASRVPSDVLARAEVLVTGWGTQQVDLALLARMPRLRAVVHTGGSVRKVVTPAVMEHGLLVSTQAGTNAEPVAEYTCAMVTLSLKSVFQSMEDYRRQRDRIDVYDTYRVASSHLPTVGVVGASRIGRSVIARLRSRDLRILLYDPYCQDAAELGVELVGLDELFSASDVVTLHAPGTDETRGMITAAHLALLRDGATLVNTARGTIVDGRALEAELVAGRIWGILDVTDPLVPAPGSALWGLPNVLLTPHMAGAVGSELAALGAGAAAEIQRCLNGDPMQYLVTVEQFDRSA